MTGIEPALSAWEFADSIRFMQPDQQFRCSLSIRERPLITASNGPLMARRRGSEERLQHAGRQRPPVRVTAALPDGTEGQRIGESGDTGDTCLEAVSPPLAMFPSSRPVQGHRGQRGHLLYWHALIASTTPVGRGAAARRLGLVDIASTTPSVLSQRSLVRG
jgi:hypothetical protein